MVPIQKWGSSSNSLVWCVQGRRGIFISALHWSLSLSFLVVPQLWAQTKAHRCRVWSCASPCAARPVSAAPLFISSPVFHRHFAPSEPPLPPPLLYRHLCLSYFSYQGSFSCNCCPHFPITTPTVSFPHALFHHLNSGIPRLRSDPTWEFFGWLPLTCKQKCQAAYCHSELKFRHHKDHVVYFTKPYLRRVQLLHTSTPSKTLASHITKQFNTVALP